ncbi:hypothetical protein AYL99_03326 [Fonsecaea erecta]|uniref:Beta-lactamase-related domain-containing protein n=1 Tax=Fonsecaea erecta TaxID=1367422 RepID=A0A178ZQ36_9EURO|nr:hypothetical protein AYL99_03326 [Fonsecaea erecta]OAP61125.1 hypothetical protein AYL99_03326 [Fonsecaea erecta]
MDVFFGEFEQDWDLLFAAQPRASWFYGQGLDWAVPPQLNEAGKAGLKELRDRGLILAEIPPEIPVDHALGGLYFATDVPCGRSKTSIAWDGLTNSNWLLDREAGIAMVLFVQILLVDSDTKILWSKLEREVYAMLRKMKE